MACAELHHVLIVDDDLDIQEALCQLFAAHGFEIEVARTGAEAIQ
jgi:DNA-binding response OmpR family regulator